MTEPADDDTAELFHMLSAHLVPAALGLVCDRLDSLSYDVEPDEHGMLRGETTARVGAANESFEVKVTLTVSVVEGPETEVKQPPG